MEGGGVKQAPIADGGQFLPCFIGRPFRACLAPPPPPRVPNFNEGSLQTVKFRRSPPARHGWAKLGGIPFFRIDFGPSGQPPCTAEAPPFVKSDSAIR